MPDYNLGTARGTIEIEYKGDGAKKAREDIDRTSKSSEDAGERADKAGTMIAAGGAAIAAGLALAVKTSADFSQQLSNVQAVSGASAAEMQQLRDKSLQLGKDTAFSASESAAAIEELVKAGVSVGDVMNGAADATVALAAAGGVSMPEAAAQASNAMNQFGLAAKDLPRVADLIAGAANASAIDVSDFGYSLSQVGAVANLAGLSFDDTATAIALMGNAGIKGSDAGTSLKSMLMNLQPATRAQGELMMDLGIVTEDGANKFYTAAGELKSFSEVSDVLADSLKGMSKEQKQAALETMFGSDAIRAAAIFAEQGADGFDKVAESMGKVSAAEVAETRMDNLKGSMEELGGAAETLLIHVGTPLEAMFKVVVDAAGSFLDMILMIPGPVLQAVTIFAALLSGGMLLYAGFLKVGSAISLLKPAFMLMTGPIGIAIALVAALVAAFVYFYQNSAGFRAFVQGIGAAIRDAFGAAVAFVLPLIQSFGAFLAGLLPHIQAVGTFLAGLAGPVIGMVTMIGGQLMQLVGIIANQLRPAFAIVGAVVRTLVGVFVGVILPVLMRVGRVFFQVFVVIVGNAIRTAFGIVRGVLNMISGVIKVFTSLLTGNWRGAWQGVMQILRGAVGIIMSIIRGLSRGVGALIKGFATLIVNGVRAIPGLLRGLGGLFAAAGRFIIQAFVNSMKNASGLISGIASNVWLALKSMLNGAISRINAALEFSIKVGPKTFHVDPPNIQTLATGGVTNGPMLALIGDNPGGQEAVVPLDQLWREMHRIFLAGRTVAADPAAGRSGPVAGPRDNLRASRLVEGRLSIDASGRAFIRGVAEDVLADDQEFNDMRRLAGAW